MRTARLQCVLVFLALCRCGSMDQQIAASAAPRIMYESSRDEASLRTVTFQVREGESYIGTIDYYEKLLPTTVAWSGELDGGRGEFTLIEHDERRFARLYIPDRVLELAQKERSASYTVHEFQSKNLRSCAADLPSRTNLPAGVHAIVTSVCDPVRGAVTLDEATSDAACLTTPITKKIEYLDTLIAVTDDVYSNHPWLITMLTPWISVVESNRALARSNVPARLRISRRTMPGGTVKSCIEKTVYNETGSLDTALASLYATTDAELDHVSDLREQCKADLVFLLLDRTDAAGKACTMTNLSAAYKPFAYAVVNFTDARLQHSLTHEMGHMMGGGHDRMPGTTWVGMCEDSAGWSYIFNIGGLSLNLKTMMGQTESGYYRSLRFSDPSISSGGSATGSIVEKANNARTLRVSAPVVSAFR
jgi:hypothetical protein